MAKKLVKVLVYVFLFAVFFDVCFNAAYAHFLNIAGVSADKAFDLAVNSMTKFIGFMLLTCGCFFIAALLTDTHKKQKTDEHNLTTNDAEDYAA